MSIATAPLEAAARSRTRGLRRSRRSAATWLGIVLALGCVAIGLLGPFFAPHDPAEFVGLPLTAPSAEFPLGLDYLGRDALSRFLSGGRTAILLAVLGFAVGASLGLTLGLVAAYSRGAVDRIVDRTTEVLVGFPSLVLMLLIVAGLGSELWVIVVALAAVHLPRVARIVRAAAIEVRHLPYVEVAEARGERRSYVMFSELWPGVRPAFLVDAGMRIPASILLVASLSFLGVGIQPPASDWGLIISENRAGLTTQPWAVAAPVAALALLMIGVNLAIDGLQRERPLRVRGNVD